MNFIWNKNLELFKNRFPQLYQILNKSSTSQIVVETAKNGSPTAREGNLQLHSKYNPEKEAETFVSNFDSEKKDILIFFGFGLGYSLIEACKKFPSHTIIAFESREDHFFFALENIDWSQVFSHEKLILVIGADEKSSAQILNQYPFSRIQVFRSKSQSEHDKEYFDSLEKTLNQSKQKDEINTNTLEKFASLWTGNSLRNINYIETLGGVKHYFGKASSLPFVILAAGPSLESIMPHLMQIKKRSILVCVDTALHACLKAGVEPDFIIIADPQYWCSLHLEFLESPSSVLIGEIAVYPSVFRFNCRKKVLFSSLFPIGQYFEKKIDDEKGKLAAGGSVSTTAWDFARRCGTKEIFLAGMDLGFPGNQTHIRGSQFEEKAHILSSRTKNAETENLISLYGASPFWTKDYDGNPILTDKRMSLFSWWFQNECQKENELIENNRGGTKTYTLTPQSMAIEGIEKFLINEFLKRPEIESEKKIFIESAENEMDERHISGSIVESKKEFDATLLSLESACKKGLSLCEKGLQNRLKLPEIYSKLNEIDSLISNSQAKDIVSLVFPTQRKLDKLVADIPDTTPQEKQTYPLMYSRIIYSQLLKSIREILN